MFAARLWIRREVRPTERRAPIVPDDARTLVEDGFEVTVEESEHRIFPISDYAAAGCRIAEPGTWADAPADTYVLGVKELPDQPVQLRHKHVYFAHAYKGQHGAVDLLRRFRAGGGTLLDLEYLTDDRGVRVAAFGYWAGYVGAALAVLHHHERLPVPLAPLSREDLDAMLTGAGGERTLVLGALGRSGRGARAALAIAGIEPTCWDIEETRQLDRAALRGHGILVNTVLLTEPGPKFLTPADLDHPDRRLTVVCDVTCDVDSDTNALPIYDRVTSWEQPARRLRNGPPPLDIIAIDNLPSLLPREASVAFSADLLPYLRSLSDPAWQRAREHFETACRHNELG